MKFIPTFFASVVIATFMGWSAHAHDYKVGNLVIEHPFIPATVKVAPVAAGYMTIKNTGSEDDKLLSISSTFSGKQEIHTMKMVEGVMRMRPLQDGVVIPGGGEAKLAKGGNHMMFIKLNEQMQAGEMRDVTLVFEKAGEVKIGMIVIDPADLDDDEKEDHSGHSN